jgi:3-hydroxyacyl-CoA dehydrogenase
VTNLNPKQYFGLAMRQLGDVSGIGPEIRGRTIRKVGIIGAGLMGSGIAVCFLGAAIPTVLLDQKKEALDKGRKAVRRDLATGVKKGFLTEDQARGLEAILTTSLDYDDLSDCDLIIEAVFERMDIKETVFSRLGEVAREGAILATNTSGLDVDRIASFSGRPQDVIGLHFFSPAFMMPLLEIVRGKETSAEVLKTALFISLTIKKIGVVVGNCFGFAANRMLEGYGRESEMLALEGASPEQIDKAMVDFGFPMGPCAMADLAGIDVRCHVLNSMQEAGLVPDDPRYGAVSKALLAEGRLGQKTRAGMFDYGDDGRTPIPSDKVMKIRDRIATRLGIRQRDISAEEIIERCMLPVVNEAAKVLDEGIISHASDADILWIYGYGYPMAKGGPVYQARLQGLEATRDALTRYQEKDADFGEAYWKPSPALQKLFT